MGEFRIKTERLILREWSDADIGALCSMGQDSRVMEFLGPLMSSTDTEELVQGQIVNQSIFGHCFWPVARKSDSMLLGFCGLNPGPENSPFADKLEIGWRLAFDAWGHGYALEAATAVFGWAWQYLPDDEIFAMTVVGNTRSWQLMDRLGMVRRSEMDFDHPELATSNPLRPQIVYSISRPLKAR
jgi:RimJ/RimL family protein N-acetyltransferase